MSEIEIVFFDEEGIHSKRPLRRQLSKKAQHASNKTDYLLKNFEEMWTKASLVLGESGQKTKRDNDQLREEPSKKSKALYSSAKSTLLAEKYRPLAFCDLIGNEALIREIVKWFKTWAESTRAQNKASSQNQVHFNGNLNPAIQAQQPQFLQPGLFWGPPGTGKTSFALTLARHFGFIPFVINASDERNGPELYQKLKNVLSTKSLFPRCQNCPKRDQNKLQTSEQATHVCTGAEPLIILDEVDGVINSESGSAIQYLLDKIIEPKTNRCLVSKPIIFICNNIYLKGLKNLRGCTKVFNFRKDEESVFGRLKEVLAQEGSYIDDRALRTICLNFGFDIRAVFNFLQLFMDHSDVSSESLLRHLSAYENESKSYFEVVQEICFKGQKTKIGFHYTEANIFDGLFINYLKLEALGDLRQLDKCSSLFLANDVSQTIIRSLGGVGYAHQKHAFSIVPYLFFFARQKRQFLLEFPTFLISFKWQRKEKAEILRSLTENLLLPGAERHKYIDLLFKMLHINLKSMHLQPQQQRLLISTIRLMTLVDLRVQNEERLNLFGEEKEQKADSNEFFRPKKPSGNAISFAPQIDRLFEYQGISFPLKFSEQSVILINSKYELVKNSSEHWTRLLVPDEESKVFFQANALLAKRVAPDYSNNLRYVYHEPSENAIEYPLKFGFFRT